MPVKTDTMNPSLDLLEKHNAHEQARLLQRFRELRQWQQRQQQELMQQQHQQLKAWQQEQSKVQLLIKSHHGPQWGQGPKPGIGGRKSPVLTVPNVFSDSSDGSHNNQLSLSQSLGAGVSVDSGLAVSMQDTMKSQNSLPKPIMYIDTQKCPDPADEDKCTTSDLFSNPGCLEDQLDIVREEEGKPSPPRDWKSDSSDSFMPLKLPPPRPLKGRRSDEGMGQMAGLEQLLSNAPASFLQQVLNMLPANNVRETHARYTEEVEQSASPTLLKPGQQPKARKLQFPTSQFPLEPSVNQTTVLTTKQQLPQQQKSGGVDSSQATSELQQYSGQRIEQSVPLTMHSVREDYQTAVWCTNSASDDSFDEEIEDDDDGSGDDDDDVQNQTAKQVVPPDDRPIQGIGGRKSFQQLIEEQLQTSQPKGENQIMPKVARRQPFLRKGEGISRFKSAPKKSLRKPLKKSEQRSAVAQINGSNLENARFKPSHQFEGNQMPKSKTHQSSKDVSADKLVAEKLVSSQNSTNKKTTDQQRLETDLTRQRVEQDLQLPGSKDLFKTENSTADRDSAELDSLAEFELLEDAVDNMSFRSNSSLVQKLVRNDKQGQLEAFHRLRQMGQAHSFASHILPEQHFSELKSIYKEERSGQVQDTDLAGTVNKVKDTLSSAGFMYNKNNNNNNNNKYNSSNNNRRVFDEPDTALDSSATLTDSSDEENQINEYVHQHSGQPIQNGHGVSSFPTQLSSSPTKVMPRKVVPISSRFSSEKPLSMLQSLSQQADFLSGLSAPVCFQPDVKSSVKESSSSFAHSEFQNGPAVKPAQATNSDHARFHFSHAWNGSTCNNVRTTSASILSGDVIQTDKPGLEQGDQDMSHPGLSAVRLLAEFSGHHFSQLQNTESAFRPQMVADKLSPTNKECTDQSDSDTEVEDVSDGYRRQSPPITDTADDDVKLKTVDRKPPALSAEKFDDESSWTEGDASGEDEEHEDVQEMAHKKLHVSEKTSTPPTTKLMSRLFPKLQQPKTSSDRDVQQAGQRVQPAIDGVQSRLLREKLMALDVEIERFRSENANLEILRKERENGLVKLKQEIESFQREKEQELARLEQFKKDELKKIRQEKKLFDNYQKNIRSIPDKKEREEIEALTSQFQDLQEELKKKESRWNSSTLRMKKKIAELEAENAELKEEIRLLEKKRLEWMSVQNSVKTQNGHKVWPGENGNTKSSGKGQGHVRSSTPTKQMDKVKAPRSSSGTAEHLSADMNEMTRSARASSGIGLTQGVLPPEPADRGGTTTSSSRASMVAIHQQAPAHTQATFTDQSRSTTPHSRLSAESQPNQSVPVMIESSLPVASQESSLPGSITSSAAGNRKSAAMAAREKAVIDKGDEFTEVKHPDGKVEKNFKSGAKEIHFPNGTVKEIASDGQTIVCHLANGDVRQIFPDHRVVYIFAEAEIMQTTFPDGLETFHFKNGQIEKRYPDGTVEITFPSKDVKYLFPDGGQEVILTDGTVMQYNNKGERVVEYPSGDREVHTAHFQRREFPDGIVKTVYADGRHETRFPNGRVRLRDKAGNVIMDQIVYR